MENLWLHTLPFWDDLTQKGKETAIRHTALQTFTQGTCLYSGVKELSGPAIVHSGQIRVFINAPQGGEITLYRLKPDDICILSTSYVVKNLNIAAHMEFEAASELCVLPPDVYEDLMAQHPAMKDFVLEMLGTRLSEVMWVLSQFVFSNTGQRLAQALLERCRICGNATLVVTHDAIARDIGTAREVVTRLLNHLQSEGLVALARGSVTILDEKRLRAM